MGNLLTLCRSKRKIKTIKIRGVDFDENLIINALYKLSWPDLMKAFKSHKNLLALFGTKYEHQMLVRVTQRLCSERLFKTLMTDLVWSMPTEHGSLDRKYNAVAKICLHIGCNKESYRKRYLRYMREMKRKTI